MRIQWYPTPPNATTPPPQKKNKALLGGIINERLMKKPFKNRLRALFPESPPKVNPPELRPNLVGWKAQDA